MSSHSSSGERTPITLLFQCVLVSPAQNPSDPYAGERIIMTPAYSSDPTHPNRQLFSGSPNGVLEFTVTNKENWGMFRQGETYELPIAWSSAKESLTGTGSRSK